MGKTLKRGFSVFLVLLMVFSSIPLTESFAQQITDFGVSNLLSLNASATDIPAASTSNTVSNLQSVNIINSDDSITNEEESKEEGLKRSDINYMSSGISTFNLTSQVSDYSSNPNTYTVLLLDIEAAHNMESGGQYLCTLGSPIEQVKAAALKLIEQIKLTRGTTNVAIVTFCSTVKVVQNFTDDYTTMSQAINNISANGAWANINGALKKADELLSTISDTNVDKNIVLFSQGLAYAGDYSSTGRYSQSDCGWHRLDNNIYAYQYANSAYTTAENLKSKYNLYSVGLYQSFDVVPEEGQDLLSFAKRFNNDIQNKGYYDITNINDLEFSFAQDIFNLGVAIDYNKINTTFYVYANNSKKGLVPVSNADIFLYLGNERIKTFKTDSNGAYKLDYLTATQNGKYDMDNLYISAEYQNDDYILYSEHTTDSKVALNSIIGINSYDFLLDKYCKKYNLTVAYQSGYREQAVALMDNFRGSFWNMTEGKCVIGGIQYNEYASEQDFGKRDNIWIKQFETVAANTNGYGKKNNHIYLGFTTNNQGAMCGEMIAHEAGHYFFGFRDEYCYGKGYDRNGIDNAGYWTPDAYGYQRTNGLARPSNSPSSFGIMESDYRSTRLSTSADYSYLNNIDGVDYSEVSKKHPEFYTRQYFDNKKSCSDMLDDILNGYISDIDYSVVAHGASLSSSYYDVNLYLPDSEETFTIVDAEENIISNKEIYSLATETTEKLIGISADIVDGKIKINVNSDNTQTYLFVESIEDAGNIEEITLDFSDGATSFELDYGAQKDYIITFVQKDDNGQYLKNTYTVSSFSSEISDGTFYSEMANVSADITSTNGVSNDLIIIKNDNLYVNGEFTSIDGAFDIIATNDEAQISGDFIKSMLLNSGLNYETIGVFKYENGTYTRISQGYSQGEKTQLAYVSFPYEGEGTYVFMAEAASDEEVNPVKNLSVTESSEMSGLYTVSFDDAGNDAYELAGYNIYYSKNSITDTNSENVYCTTISSNSNSGNINLKADYGIWYFAVETLAKNGAKSALSQNVKVNFNPLDSDSDGLPDYWVDKYFPLDDLVDIANADPDDDGLDNLTEYEYGTNPLNPDTDGDNVYDKIELLKDLDPLNPMTDGKTDDYVVAYGIPELEICEVSFDEDFIYFSIKNDTDGKAMRTLVEAKIEDELIAMWSVNVDERSIVQFALDRTAVEDWNGLTIEVDSEKLVRDSDYSNNTFTYSVATGISLADMDVVKETKKQANVDTTPTESNEIYSWKLVEGNCISIDELSGEITANKIGQASVSVETLSGLADECLVSVVAFEGAEYSEFDSKLINNNTEVAIIGYIGDDSSIVIPETIGSLPVTQLASNAFKGCSFDEVTIHSGINSIANNTFLNTLSLEKIVVDEANTSYCSDDGILYSLDKTQLVKYPSAKTDTIFAIPETVTSIGAYSINDCDYIEEITIPESVASIGSSAIGNSNNLKIVNYNAVSSSAPIGIFGSAAFNGSNAIEKVIIGDNVTTIPQYLFFGKNSLTEVVITENSKLSTIAQCAFYNCSKLANIFIPETVKTIGSSAFYGCSKLNGIELPETLTSIGSSAFSGCSSLTSIKIPETVTSISDNTFANCTALEKIEIPYQITTIGETPFKGCSKVVIWCYNNSVAYEYAVTNSIKYKIMELDADDLVVTSLQDTFIDGLQYQLSAEISPIYTDEKIVWSSSNSKVFTVSNTGLITAKGAGEAILTVASSRGSVSKTFNINVLGLSKDSENANLYHVRNADDMLTLSTMVNSGVSFAGKIIQLDNDIDLSNIDWTPIGIDSTYVFSGVFDGNNHTISGLNYVTTSNTYSGLFGYIKTGGIKDLTVEGSVSGISRVGMIAGCIFDSALYNCKAIGEVKRIGSGSYGYVGGLIGSALHSVIINCAAETDITVDFGSSSIYYAAVGGIVGAASTAGSDPMCILNSYCIGDISVNGNSYYSSYENYYVGGIAGYLKDDAANNYYFGEITNADEDPIKKIGYAFGYVVPEYTSESDYNGIGTIIVQDNYYLEGKNAIGLISEGDYDSSNWVSPISEENFSKLIGKGSLVDELNGNKGSVEDIIVAHRDILSNSTWTELVDRINGDSFTVSNWKIGSNNLPVNYECDCYRHAESDWVVDVEATCTKEGSKHTYCLVCQETVTTSIIEKAEHKFSDWTETKAATCTEKGSEYRTCTTCNSATETRDIAKLGHNFDGEWTTDKAPTCTKNGTESRVCTRCKSEKETRTVDKLGHDFESKWTVDKEATCSKVGSKSHHCSRCDEKSDVTVINKIAHSYRESVQEATCTKDGKKTYNCSACGDSYSEVIIAKGHIDQNGDGKCDNCDYIYDNTCDHMCHKSGFMGFIWKIVQFFWKLFKMNPTCECGVAHY